MHAGIERGLEVAIQERNSCQWWEWRRYAKICGVIEALVVMDEMTHLLMRKYNNENGQLN
jgi:hypothetical protein